MLLKAVSMLFKAVSMLLKTVSGGLVKAMRVIVKGTVS